jgi:hypothetical protein
MAQERPDQHVLRELARVVGALADAAEERARVLEQTVAGQQTYVTALRSILTGIALPESPNPGPGGDIPLPRDQATAIATGLGANTRAMVSALAEQAAGDAARLNAVKGKEEEEKKSGGTTPGSSGGSGGGTTAPAPGGSNVPAPEGSSEGGPGWGPGTGHPDPPPQPPKPRPIDKLGPDKAAELGPNGKPITEQPEPPGSTTPKPTVPPKIVTKQKRVRRCYKFTLRNTGTKPVSDLHVFGKGRAEFPRRRDAGPGGWKPANYTGDQGFGWEAPNASGHVGPGQELGPFEFCTESDAFDAHILMSHPGADGSADGSRTELNPGDITVGGKPAPTGAGGLVSMPTESRTYIYEVTFNTGTGGGAYVMSLSHPTSQVDGSGASVGPSPQSANDLNIATDKGGPVAPNTEVTVHIESGRSDLSAAIHPGVFVSPAPPSSDGGVPAPAAQPQLQKAPGAASTSVHW